MMEASCTLFGAPSGKVLFMVLEVPTILHGYSMLDIPRIELAWH